MTDRFVRHELKAAAMRQRQLLALWGIGLLWLVFAIGTFACAANPDLLAVSVATVVSAMAVAGCVVSCAWLAFVFARPVNVQRTARSIEKLYPTLDSALLTAVDEPENLQDANSVLRHEVFQLVRDHAKRHSWRRIVAPARLVAAACFNVLSFGLMLAAVGMLSDTSTRVASASIATPEAAVVESGAASIEMSVEPGDAEIERGTSLTVTATFSGTVPEAANVVFGFRGGDDAGTVYQEAMQRSLDDPVFSTRLLGIGHDAWYRVECPGGESDNYEIRVFDYPRLEQADATLEYPAYTGMESRRLVDVRRVTAIRGTACTLELALNKPVQSAVLRELDSAEEIAFTAAAEASTAEATWTLTTGGTYELHLVDAEGRRNKQPPRFRVAVLDNKRPKIRLERPKRDVSVSPLEELDLEATISDDFPVERVGIAYTFNDREEEIVLWDRQDGVAGTKQVRVDHRFLFESFEAVPDDVLAYSLWVMDTGPDGVSRRTSGDLQFAEVRPFEEIYRQGQSGEQSGQQPGGGAAQQAEELLKLQKQILTATWNVIRDSQQSKTVPQPESVQTLIDSQEAALDQLTEVIAELQDERSRTYAGQAQEAMASATDQFRGASEAIETVSPEVIPKLDNAYTAAREAYQQLLKLRAREHEVSRSQSQSGQQGSSRQQESLDELELDEDDPRYESQQQAQAAESAEQQEDRQFLSRLRELARRQADLNERIKELQSALDQAENAEEKAEIERRLKRLREEQQQVLRDAEELGQKMAEASDPSRNAEAQESLDAAQQQARQASEALEQGQVSRAAVEGERAEEAFEQLRDEFQQKTAGQFANDMRELSDRAERLANQQQSLRQQMREGQDSSANDDERPSLRSPRSTTPSEELVEAFDRQQEDLQQLLNRAREVTRAADAADQAILAERLYEAVQDASRRSIDEALDRSQAAYRRGLNDDAERYEEIAADGINTLREQVDEAAESVLSDETEALRRAREALTRARQDLDTELARNGGASAEGNPEQADRTNEPTQGSSGSEPRSGGDDSGEKPQPSGQRAGGESDQERSRNGSDGSSRQDGGERSDADPNQGDPKPGEVSPSEQSEGESPASPQQGTGSNGEGSPQSGGQERSGQGASASGSGENGQSGSQPSPSGSASGGQGGAQPNGGARSSSGPRSLSDRTANRSDAGGGGLGAHRGNAPMQRTERDPNAAPLTGDDFVEWSDQLRDVEELLNDPELRAQAAAIRDRAREIRKDVRRNSAEPNWDVVRTMISEPLADLQQQVENELIRRTSDGLVPLDRRPIPPEFEAKVQEYYRRLGVGR